MCEVFTRWAHKLSYLPLSFSHSGPKWTDSSGLVWWPAKHLSQSCLCEKSWFEGHWHVERQHLELQRWTGGPAADRSNVECTVRMLVSSPCRHVGCITTEHTKPVHSCLTPCSAIQPCSSLLLLFFFAALIECSWMSKAFGHSVGLSCPSTNNRIVTALLITKAKLTDSHALRLIKQIWMNPSLLTKITESLKVWAGSFLYHHCEQIDLSEVHHIRQ